MALDSGGIPDGVEVFFEAAKPIIADKYNKLKGYACHKYDCAIEKEYRKVEKLYGHRSVENSEICTCGLSDLLKL